MTEEGLRWEKGRGKEERDNNNNSLLKEIGLKISVNIGESREASFLYLQRISLPVQRFNAILLHDSLPTVDCADWIYPRLFSYS